MTFNSVIGRNKIYIHIPKHIYILYCARVLRARTVARGAIKLYLSCGYLRRNSCESCRATTACENGTVSLYILMVAFLHPCTHTYTHIKKDWMREKGDHFSYLPPRQQLNVLNPTKRHIHVRGYFYLFYILHSPLYVGKLSVYILCILSQMFRVMTLIYFVVIKFARSA